MIYRFFVALLFNVVVFPFVAMYSFSLSFPDAHFAFDQATWLQGGLVILFGWVLFLLPGLLPFVGYRYYDWAARKVGLTAVVEEAKAGIARASDRLRWANLKLRTALSNRSSAKESLAGIGQAIRRSSTDLATSIGDKAQSMAKANEPNVSSPAKPGHAAFSKARDAFRSAPMRIANVKESLSSLREKLTPDELQRTIDLNQYTLEAFKHLKAILLELVPTAGLSDDESRFCSSVINAIPEPPSPSATTQPLVNYNFVYPTERRDELKIRAAEKKVVLRDTDFVAAQSGDLERGLLIVKSILLKKPLNSSGRPIQVEDDILLGLPMGSAV